VRTVVDLFPHVLADVPDVEVTGCAVEGEAPGIAQPVANRAPPRARLRGINTEQLPQWVAEGLRMVLRVAARTAVAHADVQQTVRPELSWPPL
jgi:hypothetical protein